MRQKQLFQRAENGDSLAQAELYRQHYGQTFRLAYSLLSEAQDAEEVAQDVLAYVLTHLGQYDPVRGAFNTWLYAMTVNRCRNKRRRKQLAQIPLLHWLKSETKETVDVQQTPDYLLQQDERHQAVHQALEQLPNKQREATVLRYFHELSYDEIGQILNCSASTAQSRVWLGQKRLYQLLAGGLADERVSRNR